MKPLPLALLAAALMVVESRSQTPTAKSAEVKWDRYTLREVTSMKALPVNLLTALGVGLPDVAGIADRDGKYNSTDVIMVDGPMRRFAVAGIDGVPRWSHMSMGAVAGTCRLFCFPTFTRRRWSNATGLCSRRRARFAH